jgi:hypothetical protein
MNDVSWQYAEDVLRIWRTRASNHQRGHYRAAGWYQCLNLVLGVPAFCLSAVVGTGAFFSVEHEASATLKIAAGLVSMLAASLMALHTFLGFSALAGRHRKAGAGYAAARREMEETLALPIPLRKTLDRTLETARARMDHLAEESPSLPRRYWIKERKPYSLPSFLLEKPSDEVKSVKDENNKKQNGRA